MSKSSKQRNPNAPQHLPGNDGAWFLKAVGIDRTMTDLTDIDGDGDSTSESVRELWGADVEGADLFTQWEPGELSKSVERRRNFRWPIVISVTLVVAALVAVGLWLPTTSEGRASVRSTEYAAAFGAMLGDLPPTQQALATLTEPSADVSQFPEIIPTITRASGNAAAALDLAGEPLPRPWPLASSEPFDELTPFRDALSVDATVSQAITRRLGDLLDYRTVFQDFLVIGELPTTAEGVDLNTLTGELATATADSAAVLGELPDDAALADHKEAAEEVFARFSELQAEYVEALRSDEPQQAVALVEEYTAMRVELDEALVAALARMRSEVDDSLISLNGRIEETVAELAS